jgi:V/A-type H+/Na+-transporting ATPase subunit A
MAEDRGTVYRISGPVVTALGIHPRMYDVVLVGEQQLMGEVIGLEGDRVVVQVYEDTSGIRPGEPIVGTGQGLVVELGPGLLSSIYDGVQRPLVVLRDKMGDFISRGVSAPGLDRKKKWEFKAVAKVGDHLKAGQVLGTVQETPNITHKILVPPLMEGKVAELKSGSYTVEEVIGKFDNGTALQLMHRWPVRRPRPILKKELPDVPLLTGQRILDGLFPVAKGGTAAIPGPFGSGKTVTQQQLAKWSDATIVVYIGCGERGNEMTEVLTEFPELKDPKTGGPLMDRTVLIANTSNMPVAAREASVYTGMTIAEYYRDQGFDVSLMADSTSRWAEAMREISSRLEEMPGEEGYPAYLAARLSEFYERAGRVKTLNGEGASVSVIGAVSPPGGDFSEPVTQNTLRIVKVFWALDAKLAQRRHFPAINWLNSYSLYTQALDPWFVKNVASDWPAVRGRAMDLLQREAELQEIVQLVGSDALPEDQQLVLEITRLIREVFLQQNAYHAVDTYCSMQKQYRMLKFIMRYADQAGAALTRGAPLSTLANMKAKAEFTKVKFEVDFEGEMVKIEKMLDDEFKTMEVAA